MESLKYFRMLCKSIVIDKIYIDKIMKTFLLAALVCLLLGTANAVTHYTWNYNRVGANPSIGTQRPFYDLGYIYQDNTIEVNLTVPGTTAPGLNDLAVTIHDKNDNANLPTAVGTCVAADVACTFTFALTQGGNYYAIIRSQNNEPLNTPAVKLFYLEISYYLTSSGGPTNSSAVIYPLRKST